MDLGAAQLVEPEIGQPGEDATLVGNPFGEHDVERRQPVRRDEEERVSENEHLAHLADRSALDQGPEQPGDRAVERERRQHEIPAHRIRVAQHPRPGGDNQVVMGDDHALRPPGRSGGEEHVRDIVPAGSGQGARLRLRRRIGRYEGNRRPLAEHRLNRPPADQETEPGILDDEPEPFRRVGGIEGHVRGAGLQDREDVDHGLRAPLGHDPDHFAGLDPEPHQLPREPGRAGLELAVGHPRITPDDRECVRRAGRLLGDELVDGAPGRVW